MKPEPKDIQIRVATCGHTPLVTVLWTTTGTLVPRQASKALGVSKLQLVLQLTVLLLEQVITGGAVSTTVTAWVHVAEALLHTL